MVFWEENAMKRIIYFFYKKELSAYRPENPLSLYNQYFKHEKIHRINICFLDSFYT